MKTRNLLSVAVLSMTLAGPSIAASGMTVQTWDPALGCEYDMTTNNFQLAPRDSVEVDLNLGNCSTDKLGGMLYFGYNTTKSWSRPLTSNNNVRLTLVNQQTGEEIVSDSGSIYIELSAPGTFRLFAENMSRTKGITIRLRSTSGL